MVVHSTVDEQLNIFACIVYAVHTLCLVYLLNWELLLVVLWLNNKRVYIPMLLRRLGDEIMRI